MNQSTDSIDFSSVSSLFILQMYTKQRRPFLGLVNFSNKSQIFIRLIAQIWSAATHHCDNGWLV